MGREGQGDSITNRHDPAVDYASGLAEGSETAVADRCHGSGRCLLPAGTVTHGTPHLARDPVVPSRNLYCDHPVVGRGIAHRCVDRSPVRYSPGRPAVRQGFGSGYVGVRGHDADGGLHSRGHDADGGLHSRTCWPLPECHLTIVCVVRNNP